MRAMTRVLATANQTWSYILGGLVIAIVLVVATTTMSFSDITHWASNVLGLTFTLLLGGLVFLCLFCWVRLIQSRDQSAAAPWYAAGVQAANGVATLALTYTLLGISLGIGSLGGQSLSPETVQDVIRELTEHFSMAFMTTVVGLPLSTLLRGLIVVTGVQSARNAAARAEATPGETGDSR